MALVPVIQPPIMKALTTKKERQIVMEQLRPVSKTEKIVFPIMVTIVVSLLLPSAAPLVGMLMLGNLFRVCGVVTDRLSDTAQNALMNIVTIFLGVTVGATATAEVFLAWSTIKIMLLGVIAFSFGTAGGVLFAKLMCKVTGGKINPLIGSAGVSAVPMAARVCQVVGQKENPKQLPAHACDGSERCGRYRFRDRGRRAAEPVRHGLIFQTATLKEGESICPNRKFTITDTILRDAHQSQAATRMRTDEMLPACEYLDKAGYYSLECWGGATFDACLRFLNEDPWERLRKLRKALPNTKLQMLLRGQNILGYKHYADDVVDAFVKKSIDNGIDIIRMLRRAERSAQHGKGRQGLQAVRRHRGSAP